MRHAGDGVFGSGLGSDEPVVGIHGSESFVAERAERCTALTEALLLYRDVDDVDGLAGKIRAVGGGGKGRIICFRATIDFVLQAEMTQDVSGKVVRCQELVRVFDKV